MLKDSIPFIPLTLTSETLPSHQGFLTVSMGKYHISVEMENGDKLWIKLKNPALRLVHLEESQHKGPVVSVIKHDIYGQGETQVLTSGGGANFLRDFQVTIMSSAISKMADPSRDPAEPLEGRWTGLDLLDQSISIVR